MIATRRSFITGLVGLIAAPAIVRATSIMPVKSWDTDLLGFNAYEPEAEVLVRTARFLGMAQLKVEGMPVRFDDPYPMLASYRVAPGDVITSGSAVWLDCKDGYARSGPTPSSNMVGHACRDSAPKPLNGIHILKTG